MGGRATRRKRVMMLKAGLGVGLGIGVLMACFLYFLYSRPIK